jgi:hypothetical protein
MKLTTGLIGFLINFTREDDDASALIRKVASDGGDALRDLFLRQFLLISAKHIDWDEVATFFSQDTTPGRA